MSVLKIKNEFGEWEDITSIRGADGKDGAIQYQAGKNISIENDTISTSALNENEVQDLIDKSIEELGDLGFMPLIVDELPSEDINEHTIYLVAKEGTEQDVYDEYLYINNGWEHIGSTAVDLSDYYTKNEVDKKTNYLGSFSNFTSENRLDVTNMDVGTYVISDNGYKVNRDNILYLKAIVNDQEITFNLTFSFDGIIVGNILYFIINKKITSMTGYDEFSSIGANTLNTNTNTINYSNIAINFNSNTKQMIKGSRYTSEIKVLTPDAVQTISGKKTFSTLPETSVVPTNDEQFVNKKYVDDNISDISKSLTPVVFSIDLSATYINSTNVSPNSDDLNNINSVIQNIQKNNITMPIININNTKANNYSITPRNYLFTHIIVDSDTKKVFRGFVPYQPEYNVMSEGTYFYYATLTLSGTTADGLFTATSGYISGNKMDFLTKDNTVSYTPSGLYNPATKKYVDDLIAGISGGSTSYDVHINSFTTEPTTFVTTEFENALNTAYGNADYIPTIRFIASDSNWYGMSIASVSIETKPDYMIFYLVNPNMEYISLIEVYLTWENNTCSISNVIYRNYYDLSQISIERGALATENDVNNTTGLLEDLSTSDKSNLVAAINEIAGSSGGSTDIKLGILKSWTDYNVANLDEGIYVTGGSRVKLNGELITWSSYNQSFVFVSKSNSYSKYAIVFNPRNDETSSIYRGYYIKVFRGDNSSSFIDIDLANADPTKYTGYDATKTQVLKNINGTLTWVDEE